MHIVFSVEKTKIIVYYKFRVVAGHLRPPRSLHSFPKYVDKATSMLTWFSALTSSSFVWKASRTAAVASNNFNTPILFLLKKSLLAKRVKGQTILTASLC